MWGGGLSLFVSICDLICRVLFWDYLRVLAMRSDTPYSDDFKRRIWFASSRLPRRVDWTLLHDYPMGLISLTRCLQLLDYLISHKMCMFILYILIDEYLHHYIFFIMHDNNAWTNWQLFDLEKQSASYLLKFSVLYFYCGTKYLLYFLLMLLAMVSLKV